MAVRDGVVLAVGAARDVRAASPAGARAIDLGDVVLMPGLVDPHVHLELSWMAADPPRGRSFTDWIRSVIERRRDEDARREPEETYRAARALVARAVVAVGDVSNLLRSVDRVARAGLDGVVFHELFGEAPGDAEAFVASAVATEAAAEAAHGAGPGRLRIVPAAHAPYTTAGPVVRAIAARARAHGDPLSIHVAESADEVELFASGRGPLADLLRERGIDTGPRGGRGLSPVAWLDAVGALGPRTLAVHCVHVSDEDLDLLADRRVTVVTCPRSNRALGVGSAPVERMVARGIPVALGTDSLASVPDLDPFEEMATLAEAHPGLAPADVVRAATLAGARALGLDRRLGSIAPGKCGRIACVRLDVASSDPLEALCGRPVDVRALDGG